MSSNECLSKNGKGGHNGKNCVGNNYLKESKHNSDLQDHAASKVGFECLICGKIMKTEEAFHHHIVMFHRVENLLASSFMKKKMLASKSSKRTSDKKILSKLPQYVVGQQKVENDANDLKPIACNMCTEVFESVASLTRHYVIHDNGKPYICGLCSRVFSDESSLIDHNNAHGRRKNFECKICKKKFKYPKSLRLHGRKHDLIIETNQSTDQVRQNIITKLDQGHKVVGTEAKKHKCNFCKKYLSSFHSLQRHKRSIHLNYYERRKKRCKRVEQSKTSNVRKLQCQRRSSQLSKSALVLKQGKITKKMQPIRKVPGMKELKKGMVMNNSEKFDLKNSELNLRLSSKTDSGTVKRNLEKGHVTRKNTVKKSFKCKECPKKYISYYYLWKHKVTYHRKIYKNTFPCDLCLQRFTSIFLLKQHKQLHHIKKGTKSSIPNTSQKILTTNHSLTKEEKKCFKLYTCDICQENFTSAYFRKKHRESVCKRPRPQVNERNPRCKLFRCYLCLRDFSRKCHLYRHRLSHPHKGQNHCKHCKEGLHICESGFHPFESTRNRDVEQHHSASSDLEKDGEILISISGDRHNRNGIADDGISDHEVNSHKESGNEMAFREICSTTMIMENTLKYSKSPGDDCHKSRKINDIVDYKSCSQLNLIESEFKDDIFTKIEKESELEYMDSCYTLQSDCDYFNNTYLKIDSNIGEGVLKEAVSSATEVVSDQNMLEEIGNSQTMDTLNETENYQQKITKDMERYHSNDITRSHSQAKSPCDLKEPLIVDIDQDINHSTITEDMENFQSIDTNSNSDSSETSTDREICLDTADKYGNHNTKDIENHVSCMGKGNNQAKNTKDVENHVNSTSENDNQPRNTENVENLVRTSVKSEDHHRNLKDFGTSLADDVDRHDSQTENIFSTKSNCTNDVNETGDQLESCSRSGKLLKFANSQFNQGIITSKKSFAALCKLQKTLSKTNHDAANNTKGNRSTFFQNPEEISYSLSSSYLNQSASDKKERKKILKRSSNFLSVRVSEDGSSVSDACSASISHFEKQNYEIAMASYCEFLFVNAWMKGDID